MKKSNTLSKDDVVHLAKLSALEISNEETEGYVAKLSETLSYISNLEKIDTTKVEPTSNVTGLTNRGFEDGIDNRRSLTGEEIEDNAKERKNGLFVVKRLIG